LTASPAASAEPGRAAADTGGVVRLVDAEPASQEPLPGAPEAAPQPEPAPPPEPAPRPEPAEADAGTGAGTDAGTRPEPPRPQRPGELPRRRRQQHLAPELKRRVDEQLAAQGRVPPVDDAPAEPATPLGAPVPAAPAAPAARGRARRRRRARRRDRSGRGRGPLTRDDAIDDVRHAAWLAAWQAGSGRRGGRARLSRPGGRHPMTQPQYPGAEVPGGGGELDWLLDSLVQRVAPVQNAVVLSGD